MKIRALLVVLVACGGNDPVLPDAAPLADASAADAPPGTTITVRVSQEDQDLAPGDPIANAAIAVVPPSGPTVIWTTDTAGTAIVDFPLGSTLWVAHRNGGPPTGAPPLGYLYLLHDIAPGDTVVLGAQPRPTASSTAGTATVTFTPLPGPTAPTHSWDSYWSQCADGGFESSPGVIEFQTTAGCPAPTRELVITAFDANSGNQLGWLRVPGVGPLSGPVDGTGAAWDTTGAAYATDFTNMPVDVGDAYTTYLSAASWHTAPLAVSLFGSPSGNATTTTAVLPLPLFSVAEITSTGYSPVYVTEPHATVPVTYSVDGAQLLPMLSEGSYDDPSRTITWTEAPPLTAPLAPQLVTASFNYFNAADSSQYRWTIYASGTRTTLAIPDVPDTLTTHDIAPTEVVYPDLWMVHVPGSSYAGLLSDIDIYRIAMLDGTPDEATYRPTGRAVLSGGYGGQVKLKRR